MNLIQDKVSIIYDGSFEGLLCVVFAAFELRLHVESIYEGQVQNSLFTSNHMNIDTDESKSDRVLKAIEKRFGKSECTKLYRVFLTEDKNRSLMLYRYIVLLFREERDMRTAYQLEEVIYVKEQLKKMRREVHRMHAFVRFQQTKDDLYYSVIEPDFNVIPFVGKHFEKRYSSMRWMIYDKRRDLGIYYDLKRMNYFSSGDKLFGKNIRDILAEGEEAYEAWWRTYFSATNIEERKNMKLHLRHVPKRYWKYLTEKQ